MFFKEEAGTSKDIILIPASREDFMIPEQKIGNLTPNYPGFIKK